MKITLALIKENKQDICLSLKNFVDCQKFLKLREVLLLCFDSFSPGKQLHYLMQLALVVQNLIEGKKRSCLLIIN